MSFENASITWSANQLAAMVRNERIVFTNIVQRGLVWERSRKSRLIESCVLSVPIPAVYARRFDDGSGKRNSNVYDIMDGKQRLSTISQFINNEFKLSVLDPVTFYNELTNNEETVDISEKTFEELPEGIQEKIKNTRISVIYFDNLTKYEERELFKRLNSGKPLSAKSRTLASCKDIEGLLNIGSHKLFNSVDGMLTEKATENKNQASIVMKCWCMMNMNIDDISFDSKIFNPLLEKTEISDTEKLAMIEVFNLIFDTHFQLIERSNNKVAKKLYTETHMVSLIPFFDKAVKDGIGEELMADWITEFFTSNKGASIDEEYNNACGSGSAKNTNIVIRNDILEKSYNNFFKEDANDSEYNSECDSNDDDDNNSDAYEIKSITDSIMEDIEEVGDAE